MFRFIVLLAFAFLCLTSSSQAHKKLVELAKEVGVIEKSPQHLTERVYGAKVKCIYKSTYHRQHFYCPRDYFLASWRLQRGGHHHRNVKYVYRCCK